MIQQTPTEETFAFAEEGGQEEGSTGEGGGQPPLQRPVQHVCCTMHTKRYVNPLQLASVHALQELRELHCCLGSTLCKALAISLHCYCYHNKTKQTMNHRKRLEAVKCSSKKTWGKKVLTSKLSVLTRSKISCLPLTCVCG